MKLHGRAAIAAVAILTITGGALAWLSDREPMRPAQTPPMTQTYRQSDIGTRRLPAMIPKSATEAAAEYAATYRATREAMGPAGLSLPAHPAAPAAEAVQSFAPPTTLPPLQPDLKMPLDRYAKVDSDGDFALLFFALVGEPLEDATVEKLAPMLSEKYRYATDSFQKQQLLKALKPQLELRMQAFKSRYFVLSKPMFLGHYDTAERSFLLYANSAAASPWSFDGPWAWILGNDPVNLAVSNLSSFLVYSVPDEATARRLEAQSQLQRVGEAGVYMFAEDVSPEGRTVMAKILRVRLRDHFGKVFGEFGLAQ